MANYGPQEDAHNLFLEKTFMVSTFVGAVGYGVQLVMYFTCASYLWKQRNCQGKHAFFRLSYITVLLILESLVMTSSTWVLLSMYINNRDYPGGPMAWFLASANQPLDAIFFASLFALTFLSDLLVLWRCWVIWSAAGRLVASAILCGPVVILLSSLVLGIMWAYQSIRPGDSLYSHLPIDVGTAYYVTSLGVNLLLTALIILRLLLYRRAVLRTLPADYTKHYLSVATIVIESVLLYSVFALAFIVTYVLNNPMNQVFMYMSSACQQIAGYMIILRVAQGRAWSSDTLASGTVSTNIRFNPPVHTKQSSTESWLDQARDKKSDRELSLKTKLNIQDSV